MANSVRVINPGVVYVVIADRSEFDAIALPVVDHREFARAQPLMTKSTGGTCRVYFIHYPSEGEQPA